MEKRIKLIKQLIEKVESNCELWERIVEEDSDVYMQYQEKDYLLIKFIDIDEKCLKVNGYVYNLEKIDEPDIDTVIVLFKDLNGKEYFFNNTEELTKFLLDKN